MALPTDALARVALLSVVETFGTVTSIKPAELIDHQTLGVDRPWLFVAPTLAGALEGPVLERVDFARDEEAMPRGGVSVTRRWQMVRRPAVAVALWLGR